MFCQEEHEHKTCAERPPYLRILQSFQDNTKSFLRLNFNAHRNLKGAVTDMRYQEKFPLDMTSSFRVRIRIFSRWVGYLFLV